MCSGSLVCLKKPVEFKIDSTCLFEVNCVVEYWGLLVEA